MMSNGPVRSLRSLNSRSRVISAASISAGPRSTWTLRKPSLRQAAQTSCAGPGAGERPPAGRSRRSGAGLGALPAQLLGDVEHDRDRAARRARGRCEPAPARACCCTLVASTTVSRPAASRSPATWCSASNAAADADWSFSSSATMPRNASDESTCVGAKCLRAKVDLPDPVTPTSTTRQRSGIRSVVMRTPARVKTASWVGAPTTAIVVADADADDADPVAVPGCDVRTPRPRTRPGSTRTGGRGDAWRPPPSPRSGRCTPRWAWSRPQWTVERGRTRRAASAGRRGGSRCSMTSISTAASNPTRRSSE